MHSSLYILNKPVSRQVRCHYCRRNIVIEGTPSAINKPGQCTRNCFTLLAKKGYYLNSKLSAFSESTGIKCALTPTFSPPTDARPFSDFTRNFMVFQKEGSKRQPKTTASAKQQQFQSCLSLPVNLLIGKGYEWNNPNGSDL